MSPWSSGDVPVGRPWVPADVERPIEERSRWVAGADLDVVWEDLERELTAHIRYHDHEVVNLNPAANVPGPRVSALLGSTIGSRPSLGYPGAKYETGLAHADLLEVTASALLRRLIGCRFVEHRVPSGAIANLYAYMATTRPGDVIMSLSPEAGGHATHHEIGAAGRYGLRVEPIPYDADAMSVDLTALAEEAARLQPRLIVIGASLCLTRFPVAEVRAIADDVGAHLLYDAAHVSGLIVGGEYQQPLVEGAHLMTSSTYKAFGGPPGGFVATNEADLAERIDAIAYPGLTANFDLARTVALAAACLDLLAFGAAYARACVANAAVLAESLAEGGVDVHRTSAGVATVTHHLALRAARYGGGDAATRLLEGARLLVSAIGLPLPPVAGDLPGIRLGTPEVTRWGMGPEQMRSLAGFLARVLVAGEPAERVGVEVLELRKGFQHLHYVHH